MKQKTLRKLIIYSSITLFVASLTQPAFVVDIETDNISDGKHWSILLCLLGWMGLADGMVAWFANPALFMGWFLTQHEKFRIGSLVCSLVALALSLSFLMHDQIMLGESGNKAVITSYYAGYWLWVSSIVTLVLGNLVLFFGSSKQAPPPTT